MTAAVVAEMAGAALLLMRRRMVTTGGATDVCGLRVEAERYPSRRQDVLQENEPCPFPPRWDWHLSLDDGNMSWSSVQLLAWPALSLA